MENQEQICKVVNLSNNDILPNRFQPRKYFDEEDILQLSESIKEHGVINPIIVRKLGDKYELVAGERRYKANILAGNDSIPSIIMDVNDKESSEIAVVENIQRRDLNAIEEAISYKRILDIGYMTQEQLAQKMGKSQSAIANKIRLLKLSDDVQDALMKKQISERHARSLLKLSSQQKQNEMLQKIINERLTVRKTDEEIDKMNNNTYENPNESLAPIMPDSTIADVNISTVPNYGTIKTIPTEPMGINNPVDNAIIDPQNNGSQTQQVNVPPLNPINDVITPIQPSPVVEPQPQSVDVHSLNPINDVVTPIQPSPVVEPQTSPVDVPPLNPINDVITPIQPSPVVEPQPQQVNVPPINPINEVVTPVQPSPVVEPQTSPVDIPPLNQINEVVTPVQPSPVVEPQPSTVDVPPINPINEVVTPVQPSPVVEPQTQPVDVPPLNPINDVITPIQPSPVVEPQTQPVDVPPINSINDVITPTQTNPIIEPQNSNPQTNNNLSFMTSPIIDTTTTTNNINDLSGLNNLDSNIDNNSNQPAINNNQFETIPEPIIVNDYNQQYDPIMPDTQNQNPTIDFKTIINLIRKCSAAIENSGYKIETEEYNLDNLYQVVFKIDKE